MERDHHGDQDMSEAMEDEMEQRREGDQIEDLHQGTRTRWSLEAASPQWNGKGRHSSQQGPDNYRER